TSRRGRRRRTRSGTSLAHAGDDRALDYVPILCYSPKPLLRTARRDRAGERQGPKANKSQGGGTGKPRKAKVGALRQPTQAKGAGRKKPRKANQSQGKPSGRVSAPPIRRVAPRRGEQRHVVVRAGVGDRKADRDHVEERRLAAAPAEVFADVEQQLVAPGLER